MAKDTDSFWNTDWLEAQKRYLDALSSLAQGAEKEGSDEATGRPWLQAWQQFEQGNEHQRLFSHLQHQADIFQSFSKDFGDLFTAMSGTEQNAWQSVMDDYFATLKTRFTDSVLARNPQSQQTVTFWHQALQLYIDQLSAAWAFPQLMGRQAEGQAGFPDLEYLFSTPALGPTRESTLLLKENARLWQVYMENHQEYQGVIVAIGHDAIDRLRERIITLAARGEKINSLRRFYELWVSAQEEAYAETVFTEDYAQLHGRLLNSLMAFKKHNQLIIEQTLAAFNLPTSDQVGSMLRTQSKLRKVVENSLSKQQATETEIDKLKKELETIQRGLSGSPAKGRKKSK